MVDALAAQVTYYSYHRGPGIVVTRVGWIPDHKAQALADGLSTWSGGRFEAYRHGASVIVYDVQIAPNEQAARRVLAEMHSLVVRFAADG